MTAARSGSGDGRNIESELQDGKAGERGLPVDARCVNCKRVRSKLIAGRDDPDDTSSFRHVCHGRNCRGVTWWNPIRVLDREGSQ